MIGIYKITNIINGKSYIGQSVNIKRRLNAHKSSAFNKNSRNYNSPLYRAIRKYGIENFKFDILEECNESELDEKEIFYISKYQTHSKNGYNQDDGGNQAAHYTKLSDDLVSEIILRLKTTFDNSEKIGEDFGVSGRMIRGINTGENCYRSSEKYPIRESLSKSDDLYCRICGSEIWKNKTGLCLDCYKSSIKNYPDKNELESIIKNLNGNFRKIGEYYGVSDNTIRKWCSYYNMPTHSSDYKNKYIS